MLEVILCTCGKDLGSCIDLWDYCSLVIREQYKEKYLADTKTDRVMWDPKWDVELGALLDLMHLNLTCCRMNMLSKAKVSTFS